MRKRWRAERDRSDAARFDLKQGEGGLVDIEFILQALVLLHAGERAVLLANGNTAMLIEAAAQAGVMGADDARTLIDAHALLLARSIGCTLDGRSRIVERDADIEACAERVRAVARTLGLLDR